MAVFAAARSTNHSPSGLHDPCETLASSTSTASPVPAARLDHTVLSFTTPEKYVTV